MIPKILIIGSTGKLGTKLLSYCFKNNISIFGATCFYNKKKINFQKKKYNIKNIFTLSIEIEKNNFINFIKENKIDLIYFLDYGSESLKYISVYLKHNTKSYLAIANKELIIAGGSLLIDKISKTQNTLIPLDSEHFSLLRSKLINSEVSKIFITASGGPFFFKKDIDLKKVNIKQVLNHPKWKMGINNTIDSSNFINKIFEIYEVSILYKIDINKINFLVSREAYIHSVVIFKDSTVSINCFDNNMLITLIKPLSFFYETKNISVKKKYLNTQYLKLNIFEDKRFMIYKHLNKMKKLPHYLQIKFLILNNISHRLYLKNELKYANIMNFITKNLFDKDKAVKLNTFDDILKYINTLNKYYE